MKNDKANNWSQEIHSITPYSEFKHIKGKEKYISGQLLRLKTLGIYEDYDPEKPGHEYGKSIFNSDLETVCNVDTSHDANQDFTVDSVKYQLDEKDLDDLSLQDTTTHLKDPSPFKCNLDPTKVKQLQHQDMHISKIITMCKSKNVIRHYYLDEHGIAYRKIKHGPNIFHAVMVP